MHPDLWAKIITNSSTRPEPDLRVVLLDPRRWRDALDRFWLNCWMNLTKKWKKKGRILPRSGTQNKK